LLPEAVPEPTPLTGTPVNWEAEHQQWAGDTVTLSGDVVLHYRDYVMTADKVTYNRATTEVQAEGRLQVSGGPNDILIHASRGEMRLNAHIARFYDVSGSQGVRAVGRTLLYTTTNPLLYSGRELLEIGEGNYRLIDGTMTNCRLPHPDWRIIAHTIALADSKASTSNAFFELINIPIFYFPVLRHAVTDGDRESGFLIPVISNGSSIRGYTFGEQVYWAINRSMDLLVGSEYYSKRGWAPNGDFRYRGHNLNHAIVRWTALLDRGVDQQIGNTLGPATAIAKPANGNGASAQPAATLPGPIGYEWVNQGGVDLVAEGRQDLSPNTRVDGTAEYLSRYVYRLVFDDNYTQAISSQVASNIALTHQRNGLISSGSFQRFETYANTSSGNEVRILHLPELRYDVLDRPLQHSNLSWGLGSSLDYLSRSEPNFHARNVGRLDFYPHLFLPIEVGGWSVTAEAALRDTAYTISQIPDLQNLDHGIPTISHDPLNRIDAEASVDIRPPALVRDFHVLGDRTLRHVIEPELFYRYIGGIGAQAQKVLLFDTADIVTDTSQAGFSLTQRFYVKPRAATSASSQPCTAQRSGFSLPVSDVDALWDSDMTSSSAVNADCASKPREWASWQIAEEFYLEPDFNGALISGRRNIFESTLDLTGIAFLSTARNASPLVSRVRFEAIDNLRIEWDMDIDPERRNLDSNNLYAGYSFGQTTFGIVHALLNAVNERNGSATTLRTQELQPFVEFGKPSHAGLNLAANAGYEFDSSVLQFAGAEAVYNWGCCGLSLGYRHFQLGTIGGVGRTESQWLYSFTLANFGNIGDIKRSKSIFRDPALPPLY
jgi:LPS-assembly protein